MKFNDYAVKYVDLAQNIAKLSLEYELGRYSKEFEIEYREELLKFTRMSRSMADFSKRELDTLDKER